MATDGGQKGPPNISYNKGRVITVAFEAGEMQQVEVLGRTSGVFLEPVRSEARVETTKTAAPPPAARRP
jgi:hypothetical protein